MHDVSRRRVPTMDSLKVLVDRLALYKINQLQLYMENCLRLDGLEENNLYFVNKLFTENQD